MTEHSNSSGRGARPNGAPQGRTIGLWTATAGPVSLLGWVFTGAGD